MHLDGELVVGIDDFHQERKFVTEMVKVLLPNQFAHIYLKGFAHSVVSQKAIGDDRLMSLYARESNSPQLGNGS